MGAEILPSIGADYIQFVSLLLHASLSSSTDVLAGASERETILSPFTDSCTFILPKQLLEQMFLSVLYSF